MNNEMQVFNQGFTISPEQEEMLKAPMDASLIKHRPGGGGQQLSYIKGKSAIDAANRIFGYGKWGYKVLSRTLERTTDVDGNITSEFYAADIELYVVGNPFPMPGDGVGIVVPPKRGSVAEAHEKARKESVTDALKRALRNYGSQFANDLYDEDAYVDAGEGVLVKVKEVKPNSNHQPARRTVDAPQQQPPKQIQPALEEGLKVRLNALFERAKPLGILSEASAKGFLKFASEIIGTAITRPDQLSTDKLDEIEKAIVAKEAYAVQLETA